jgi:hypothetical protein
MTITSLPGYIFLKSAPRFIKFFLISSNLLKENLVDKSSLCKLIGVVNMKSSMVSFKKIGITHHVSCPHAHQQNGSAERKHHHIVEVGLALLAHASMPLKLWDEAFLTATFVIKLLPSKVNYFDTPTERLLGTSPSYDALRIFGYA